MRFNAHFRRTVYLAALILACVFASTVTSRADDLFPREPEACDIRTGFVGRTVHLTIVRRRPCLSCCSIRRRLTVGLTLHAKLRRQGRATKSRAAWRLPRLTYNRRERTASAMTPRRLWVDPGGSAAGPKPGAVNFSVELGRIALTNTG